MDTLAIFDNYIFRWLCKDIEREIEWAKEGKKAGNALCALGLLAYTEFMGGLLPTSRQSTGDKEKFNAFLRTMGTNYVDILDKEKIDIYKIFRCGLAHEYFVKGTCTIAMLNSTTGEIEVMGAHNKTTPPSRAPSAFIPKPACCGLGKASNECYYFIVEKYYEDFRKACERLYSELSRQNSSSLPFVPYGDMSDTG